MKIERILKAIASHRRLDIILLLAKRQGLSVADIADRIHLSFKATSKHLQILVATDILDRRQERLTMYYTLTKPLHPILRTVLSLL